MDTESALGPTEDSRDEIMGATYRVLCENGYARLTMRAIADEVGKSKSLLHYHYDTKDDLLLAFLDRFLDRLDEMVADLESDDPHERLLAFVDKFVIDPEDDQRRSFWLALLELRLQAAHNEEFQTRLARNSQAIRDVLATIIEDGIDQGVFRPVDPTQTATLVYDVLDGARMRQATLGEDEATREAREAVERYVQATLLDEDTSE